MPTAKLCKQYEGAWPHTTAPDLYGSAAFVAATWPPSQPVTWQPQHPVTQPPSHVVTRSTNHLASWPAGHPATWPNRLYVCTHLAILGESLNQGPASDACQADRSQSSLGCNRFDLTLHASQTTDQTRQSHGLVTGPHD